LGAGRRVLMPACRRRLAAPIGQCHSSRAGLPREGDDSRASAQKIHVLEVPVGRSLERRVWFGALRGLGRAAVPGRAL